MFVVDQRKLTGYRLKNYYIQTRLKPEVFQTIEKIYQIEETETIKRTKIDNYLKNIGNESCWQFYEKEILEKIPLISLCSKAWTSVFSFDPNITEHVVFINNKETKIYRRYDDARKFFLAITTALKNDEIVFYI